MHHQKSADLPPDARGNGSAWKGRVGGWMVTTEFDVFVHGLAGEVLVGQSLSINSISHSLHGGHISVLPAYINTV